MRRNLDLEDTRGTFRRHVLAALDTAARETFNPARNDAGATDADLPRLFAALDAQIETLAARYDVALVSPAPDHDDTRTRRALAAYDRAGAAFDRGTTRFGTSHFVSQRAAELYYRPYGFEPVDVARKLAEGEIHIGPPTTKPNQRLALVDDGTRYEIEES